eukprot:COSAG01_NODE_4831_length_4703_cov_184.304301_4_plen_165_part_00
MPGLARLFRVSLPAPPTGAVAGGLAGTPRPLFPLPFVRACPLSPALCAPPCQPLTESGAWPVADDDRRWTSDAEAAERCLEGGLRQAQGQAQAQGIQIRRADIEGQLAKAAAAGDGEGGRGHSGEGGRAGLPPQGSLHQMALRHGQVGRFVKTPHINETTSATV